MTGIIGPMGMLVHGKPLSGRKASLPAAGKSLSRPSVLWKNSAAEPTCRRPASNSRPDGGFREMRQNPAPRRRKENYSLFAMSANIRNMQTPDLGQEIRRLRQKAGMTLRGLAVTVEASAGHLSDIEHNRRRPSDDLLRRIARALRKAGATYESLDHLATGMDSDIREWAASTPGVRRLLRTLKQSGQHPLKILPALEKAVGGKRAPAKRPPRTK
jgi:transcriptional regulator with XRE-family HTH domain